MLVGLVNQSSKTINAKENDALIAKANDIVNGIFAKKSEPVLVG